MAACGTAGYAQSIEDLAAGFAAVLQQVERRNRELEQLLKSNGEEVTDSPPSPQM